MLTVLESVADFLTGTTQLDFSVLSVYDPPLQLLPIATPVYSGINADPAYANPSSMLDGHTDPVFATAPAVTVYAGISWAVPQTVDAIRVWYDSGGNVQTPPTVVVEYQNVAGQWVGEAVVVQWPLIEFDWTLIRLFAAQTTTGVRIKRVFPANTDPLYLGEIEVYASKYIEPRPAGFPDAAHIQVVHPESDLSKLSDPLITVGTLDQIVEQGEVGGFSSKETPTVFVGVHGKSDDMLARYYRWIMQALTTAEAPDEAPVGVPPRLRAGVPLRPTMYPLTYTTLGVAGGIAWWASGQRGWYETPAPVVYKNGVVVAPTQIDYARGRVRITGSISTDDVRASFTCGVWSYDVHEVVGGPIVHPAQLHHRHNWYLALVGDEQYRANQDALV